MIFHFFLCDNQGTQEKDQLKKEEDGGSAQYSLTLHSSFILHLYLQSQPLFLQNASLSAKQSLSSTAVYATNVATRYCILCVCVCVCRCSLTFIDFEGRSDGDSIKRILSIVKPRQLVRSLLCMSIDMLVQPPPLPFQVVEYHVKSGSTQ